MLELYYKKSKNKIEGCLSIIVRDDNKEVIESESIRDVVARSGAPGFHNTNGIRGKSPTPDGNYYLWNSRDRIQQYNDLDATGSEIGRFYPISSGETNHRLIKHSSGERWDIGLHDENSFRGSAGCIVVVDNSDFRKICKLLERYEARDAKFKLHVWTD
jgi:hypothetical protein